MPRGPGPGRYQGPGCPALTQRKSWAVRARIEFRTLIRELAEELGVPNTKGALVNQMARNSPAYRAGIQPGDVIVSLNGKSVDDASQFVRMLLDTPIGGTASVGVIREGRRLEIRVPVVEQRGAAR